MLDEFVTAAAARGPSPDRGELTAAAQADQILASAVSDTDDDACLVVVRIR